MQQLHQWRGYVCLDEIGPALQQVAIVLFELPDVAYLPAEELPVQVPGAEAHFGDGEGNPLDALRQNLPSFCQGKYS